MARLVKYLSTATSTAIIRCSRAHYRLVWAALSFLTKVPQISHKQAEQPCVFQVVRVSGTIRKAEQEAIRRARAAVIKAQREVTEKGDVGLEALLRVGEDGPDEIKNDQGINHNRRVDIEDDDMDEGISTDDNG